VVSRRIAPYRPEFPKIRLLLGLSPPCPSIISLFDFPAFSFSAGINASLFLNLLKFYAGIRLKRSIRLQIVTYS